MIDNPNIENYIKDGEEEYYVNEENKIS